MKSTSKFIFLALYTKINAIICGGFNEPYCIDFRYTTLDRGHECGKKLAKTPYIMNGRDADLGEYPWMVLFYQRKLVGINRGCGGSIINERWIVTSGHCCEDIMRYGVRLGEYGIGTRDCLNNHCAPPPVDFTIEYFVKHPNYNWDTIDNDICLVKLKQDIIFTEYVYPICLPIYCEIQTTSFFNTWFTVIGWGSQDEDKRIFPKRLQKVKVPFVKNEKCQELWKNMYPYHTIVHKICAGLGSRGICRGDLGGPLMHRAALYGPARYYLVGVVSDGPKCSTDTNQTVPGVYTLVTDYLSWIKDVLDSH